MKLFNTREFVTAFATRNVVFESNASFDKAGNLILRTVMEFSEQGKIKRTKVINGASGNAHNMATAVGDYQADVLDIINVLEEYRDWVVSGSTEVFSEFIGSDDLPLYFHGHRAKGFPVLNIFGKDLFNMEIYGKNDPMKQGEFATFVERVDALAECYRSHLREIDAISLHTFVDVCGRVNHQQQQAALYSH